MIRLTKMSREVFLINHNQIESIEFIPECKITMMNHDFYIVRESAEQIMRLIEEYNAKVLDIRREITVKDQR